MLGTYSIHYLPSAYCTFLRALLSLCVRQMKALRWCPLPGITGLGRTNPRSDYGCFSPQLLSVSATNSTDSPWPSCQGLWVSHGLGHSWKGHLLSVQILKVLYSEPNSVVPELPPAGRGLPSSPSIAPGDKSVPPSLSPTPMSCSALRDSCHRQDLCLLLGLLSFLWIPDCQLTCPQCMCMYYVPVTVLGTGQQWQISNEASSLPSWIQFNEKDMAQTGCSGGQNWMTSPVQESRMGLWSNRSKQTLRGWVGSTIWGVGEILNNINSQLGMHQQLL